MLCICIYIVPKVLKISEISYLKILIKIFKRYCKIKMVQLLEKKLRVISQKLTIDRFGMLHTQQSLSEAEQKLHRQNVQIENQ